MYRLMDVAPMQDVKNAKKNIMSTMASAAHDSDRPGPAPDFQLLIDSAPALIHTSLPDGYLDFFNQSWLEYVGRSLEDLQGWKWTSAIHPDDVEGIVEEWRESLASGKPFVYEARVRRADGEYRWMLHHKVAIRDEHGKIIKWHGSSIDIEDRKHAEEKIREQEVELRQVLNLTPQHVHVLTADGRLVYSNEVALRYHGSTLDDWSQLPLLQWRIDELPITLFHPDDRERVMSELKNKLLSGSAHETEARLLRNDGRYLWFLFRYSPLRDQQGQVVRWIVAGTDIEDRKQAEERLRHENVALREEIDKASMFEEIVGTSPALQKVLSRVSKVGPTDSTALLTGETGTGKELVARAIHRRSKRAARPFVSVNCAAVPRDLIASELFGHEKGAFTGALQRRLGRFELAEGGTIFLDEVGELTTETQVALLRVLQEREFERVGGNQSIRADVRVIAATNRNLEAGIAAGTFRRDLFYRLNVFPIEIPPLRERKQDIPMLVEYFIHRYARKAGKRIRTVEKTTMQLLSSYSWPGNIRELQNVVERSIIVCETETFSVDQSWLSKESPHAPPEAQAFGKKPAAQEREMIEAALTDTGGRVSGPQGAAAALGIPASTLESKIRSLKINKFRFKNARS
jgi:formate hydrogenlyase transcriptional activator